MSVLDLVLNKTWFYGSQNRRRKHERLCFLIADDVKTTRCECVSIVTGDSEYAREFAKFAKFAICSAENNMGSAGSCSRGEFSGLILSSFKAGK